MSDIRYRRVVLFLAAFPKLSETFIVSKFLGLLEKGWDVHIVCNQSDPDEWLHYPELLEDSIRYRIHKTWPINPRWLVILLYPFAIAKSLIANPIGLTEYFWRGVKRHGWLVFRRFFLDFQFLVLRPNLVHFEFGTMAVGREDLSDLLGCKEVVSFRGYDLNFCGLEQPAYYDALWKHADGLHFLGDNLRQRALRRGCPLGKIYALIPPSIDTTFFDPGEKKFHPRVGSTTRPYRILSVGRLEWKKGYEFALQAIRELIDHGIVCQYRIIGNGSHLEAVAFARHQFGLEAVVELMGAKSKYEVVEQLKWTDVLLHPAVSEGFSNAVIEAQAMMIPVVCTDADGLSENISQGKTGFVVPRRHARALAEKLILLAGNPLLRQKMGQAGSERVRRLFRIGDQIAQFEQFYLKVLSGNTLHGK